MFILILSTYIFLYKKIIFYMSQIILILYIIYLPFAMAAAISSASNVSYCNKASANCLCSFACVFKIVLARSYDSCNTNINDNFVSY